MNGSYIINHPFYSDGNKTPASGSIRKQIRMVTGTDKRGIPPQFLDSGPVRFPGIYYRLLKDMFQERLLFDTDLIKLIHIDQGKPVEVEFRIPLHGKIDAVCIVGMEFRRKNSTAESRFSTSLCTNQ